MNKYWTKRQIDQRIRLLDKTIDETDKEVAAQYIKSAKSIKSKIENLYKDILIDSTDGTLLVSDLYKYNRYYDLLNDINRQLSRLGEKEITILSKSLKNMYKENSKLLDSQMNLNSTVNKEAVDKAVNSIWCSDGKNWSSRVWTNTGILKNKLESVLVDAVATGKSVDSLTKEIMADFGASFSNAQRLVRTELAHVQNESTRDTYKENGIERYRILAEPDACDECLDLAEETFDINELVIPAHPNCRCCLVPAI